MMNETNNPLSCENMSMQKLSITLWRNFAMRDWSIEIDHVTTEVVEALVECQLIVAETSLTHQQYCNSGMSVAQRAT